MTRIAIVLCGVTFLLATTPRAAGDSTTTHPRPNILLIVADDMGYSDAGCYGGEIPTPHLDALASHGLRFTQFYNTSRCWSSRASILTGYYAQQVRRDQLPDFNAGGGQGKRPAWGRLLPDLLKPLGYRSYHSGKWHVDGTPLQGGFDASFSYSDNDHHFLPPEKFVGDEQPMERIPAGEGYFTAAAVADHAIRQLREHAAKHSDQPFFEYLTFLEPHFPLMAPKQDTDLFRERYVAGWDVLRQERWKRMTEMGLINCPLSKLDPEIIPSWNVPEAKLREKIGPGEVAHAVAWESLMEEQKRFQPIKMAIHAAMIHRMDSEIGRVVEQLKAMGAFDNTLIFFVSDNGASAEQMIRGSGHDPAAPLGSARSFICLGPGWSSAANTPLRLHKSWVHEGGISTPLIVHWPAGIAAHGEFRHDPGHLIDLAPTIVELAGGTWPQVFDGKPVPPTPGRSLVPVFAKDGAGTHDYFWFYHVGNRAIRVGNWKLVALAGKPPSWELYDLSTDRSESKNLAGEHPEKVKELEGIWTAHMEEFRDLAKQDLPAKPANRGAKSKKEPAD